MKAQLEDKEKNQLDSKSKCNKFRDGYRKGLLPVAVFYQTEQRYGVLEIYKVLDAQVGAAMKLKHKYKPKTSKPARNPLSANLKIALTYGR